jgi:Helix-turn-helix domain
MNQMLNDIQAAGFLGLKPQTLRNMRHYGEGPIYHKLGRRVVYRIADLEKYLAERRIDPEARREAL